MLDGRRLGQDQRSDVSGTDDRDVGAFDLRHLTSDASDEPVHQAGETEDGARLDALDGVLSQDRSRPHHLDLTQRRGASRHGRGRNFETGRDRSAEELALGRDDVDTRGGAEIHHDARRVVQIMCGKGIDDAIGPDLFGIVDQQRNPGPHTGFDHHVHHVIPVAHEHRPHLAQHGRHRGQSRHPGDLLGLFAQQPPQHERQLVGRHMGIGANTPIAQQFRVIPGAGEEPDHRAGVAYIDCEKHRVRPARSRPADRAA